MWNSIDYQKDLFVKVRLFSSHKSLQNIDNFYQKREHLK